MDDTISYLANSNIQLVKEGEALQANSTGGSAKVGMLWLDIEGTNYWSSSASNNVNFLQRMVNQGKARGVSMGECLLCTSLRC
jgi:hypothetical protein